MIIDETVMLMDKLEGRYRDYIASNIDASRLENGKGGIMINNFIQRRNRVEMKSKSEASTAIVDLRFNVRVYLPILVSIV
jgi:hypothetical protein